MKDKKLVDSTVVNIKRLIVLRSIGVVSGLVSLYIATKYFKLPISLVPIYIILLTVMVCNVGTALFIYKYKHISIKAFYLHLIFDALSITGVLYFAGGAANPLSWSYLIPVIIAATVLPKNYVWGITALTIISYSILMWFFQPLGHVHGDEGQQFQQHVLGMWVGYVFSSCLVAYFVTGMAATLRLRDQALNQANEQALKDEHLVALGTLATGAAHELGTPLATIAIIVSDMLTLQKQAQEQMSTKKLEIISEQIARCKQVLSVISDSAGHLRAESGKKAKISQYLNETIDIFKANRKNITLQVDLTGISENHYMVVDQLLTQSIHNVLNNAADVSPENIVLLAEIKENKLHINIKDRGPGFDLKNIKNIGNAQLTTKKDGLGLGLYLAKATIEKMGGQLQLSNRSNGGAVFLMTLPMLN